LNLKTLCRAHLGVFLLALSSAAVCDAASVNPKIASHAVIPITQNSYPKLYAAWGESGIKKINSLMLPAAEKIASSSECDRVDLVEISKSRSTPGGKIVFFVDCVNRKRFYIEDSDLKSATAIQSQTAKMSGLADSQATQSCENAIKAQLHNPLTFNRKFGTTSVYRAPTTGNVVVQFTFEAKNNLGGVLPSEARCVLTGRGIEEASISKN
jgi:hypothetical protein